MHWSGLGPLQRQARWGWHFWTHSGIGRGWKKGWLPRGGRLRREEWGGPAGGCRGWEWTVSRHLATAPPYPRPTTPAAEAGPGSMCLEMPALPSMSALQMQAGTQSAVASRCRGADRRKELTHWALCPFPSTPSPTFPSHCPPTSAPSCHL